jgi:hypothetical protein
VPIEGLELYHEAKYHGVLPQELVRQLATLASRVLEIDGRESVYIDENGRLRTARIARIATMALVEGSRRVECYLIELNDPAAFRLRRHFFSFAADDPNPANWRLEERGDPDLWFNVAVTELQAHLDGLR